MDIEVIKKNKKMIVYAIIAVLIVAIVTIATMLMINSNNHNKTSNNSESAAKLIESLRSQAETARKANNKALAISLLSQAKQQLAEQPKSDANTGAQVDVAAQQCLLGVKSACKGTQ